MGSPPSLLSFSDQREPSHAVGISTPKLNVHAKEFNPLQNSRSTGQMLGETKNEKPTLQMQVKNDLQRSKSLSNAARLISTLPEVDIFDEHGLLMANVCMNPASIPCFDLIETVPRLLIEKALQDRAHAHSYSVIAMKIIEQDKKGSFLEALLNLCRYTVAQKCLKDNKHQFHSFMSFLFEFYSLLKLKQISFTYIHHDEPPSRIILSLIVLVCESVLRSKDQPTSLEVECLFFTVTTIGRDLEAEDPKLLDKLMCAVRDAFLSPNVSPPIRKTLMQLIELRATKWCLPANAVMYYKNS